MTQSKSNDFLCRDGHSTCQWEDELIQLRQQVDELAALVSTDPLTGLANFRAFHEILAREIERTHRSFQPTTIIMLDIDHFKKINDTWGHEVGNQTLITLAKIMNNQVRMTDTVCRYGGEEFVIILPETSLKQGVSIAERIRRAVEIEEIITEQAQFQFTISLGVDIYQPEKRQSVEQFTADTDNFLYQAKNSGRNRVCHRDFKELHAPSEVTQEEKDLLR